MTDADTVIIGRPRRRRRTAWRLVGLVLLLYGLSGLILLAVVGSALSKPINQIDDITGAVEQQRLAALDSLDRASDTIDATAAGVRGMDVSLSQAKAATDQASTISVGLSTSMQQLADSMGITIFNIQPLIGLQPGFANTATQLTQLSTDLATISGALEANRGDAATVAASLDELGASLDRLRTAVDTGIDLSGVTTSIDGVRLGVLAMVVWLGVLAVGSMLAGVGCWWYAGQD